MPLISNIFSIKAALSQNLREALDRFRQGIDDAEVESIRMENKPMNSSQVGIGLGVVMCSYLTLYLLPKELLEADPFMIFFYINCLLLACIMGVIFVGQGVAPYLNKVYLNLILWWNT
jgi:hypothetical protein